MSAELHAALSAIIARFRDLEQLSSVALVRYEKAEGEKVPAGDVARFVSKRLGVINSPWWRRKLAEALRAQGVTYRKCDARGNRYFVGLRDKRRK